MVWGNWGIVHILSILLAALIIVGIYYAIRKLSPARMTIVLGILSFAGIAAIIYNLVASGAPYQNLPLHLCSINAMLLPIVVFSKNKTLGNLLLVWSLGALLSIIFNDAAMNIKLFSWKFFFYYFPHVIEFGIPVILFKTGLIKKDFRCIPSTLGITFVIYTAVHFINVNLNAYFLEKGIQNIYGGVLQVNYMFSIRPDNVLLDIFYKIVPHSYWYMLLALPIIAVYLMVIYMPQIISYYKEKKKA